MTPLHTHTHQPPRVSPPACCPQRLLDYIRPDRVHVMQEGRIVTTGDMSLVDKLELEGYALLQGSA